MNDYNLIVLSAFRYALGRSSYIVGVVCRYIKENIKNIDTNALVLIVNDIKKSDEMYCLGMMCDKQEWLDLVKYIENEIDCRSR